MRSSTLYRLVCAWPALHIFLLTLLCALVAWYVMPLASQAWLLQESGPIEAPTAGLFGLLALIGLLWRPPHSSRISWLAVCILCAAAGARPLGPQNSGAARLAAGFRQRHLFGVEVCAATMAGPAA